MPFLKYPSIENHYREKEIHSWLSYHPGLEMETYILQEKIHGSNIQLIFEPNQPFKIATRNRILKTGEDFYGILGILNQLDYLYIIGHIQGLCSVHTGSVNLYGEIYGKGIQKGVYYGEGRYLKFFDLAINDVFITQEDFELIMYPYNDYIVPIIAEWHGLRNALDFDITNIDSVLIETDKRNVIEGVVIKTLNKVYQSPEGSLFYLKKKNEEFKENSKAPKEPFEFSQTVIAQNLLFKSYVNDNRLQGIFSKYGEIQKPNQIGEYIKYLMEDAREDFLKDNDISNFNEKEQKMIFNVGGMIALMLKGYL
jgi:Rnl2 family RNA ligase